MLHQASMSGVFIVPKRFQELSQKFKSLNFQGTSSTTVSIGQYYHYNGTTNKGFGGITIGLGGTTIKTTKKAQTVLFD